MSRERLAPIPNGLLEVEVAAFPIATEAAFRLKLTSLDPTLSVATAQLWRAAEDHLLNRYIGARVEHFTVVRDQEWFDRPGSAAWSLTAWFRALTQRCLESRGPTFAPRRRESDGDPRWLARLLPPDLLAAGLWRGADRPVRLDDSPPPTALDLREAGFAETHLHIGAGLEFGSHWIGTLLTLLNQSASLARFRSPGAAFDGGAYLADWLLRAAVTRQFLGEYLADRRAGGAVGFLTFVETRLAEETGPLGVSVVLPLRAAIDDVMTGQLRTTHVQATLRWAFRAYCVAVGGYNPNNAQSLANLDPLQPFFPAQTAIGASTELQFVAAALQEMEQELAPDFELAFWQTTRLRNIYYRNLTQQALTPGLAWFVRYFDRIGAGRQAMPAGDLARIAADVSGAGRGLRYFEFRTSPPERMDAGVAYIDSVFDAFARTTLGQDKNAEAGLIYHFIRAAGGGKTRGLPQAHGRDTHANPANPLNARGYRFQSYAGSLNKQALIVARMLARHPHLLLRLRAIDLCTDELAVPVWAFVRTFRALRTVGERVSSYLAWQNVKVPPLRRTVHAGEDYPHLLTGLRIVGDTIRRLDLQPGDRLGHALALGFDPDRWAQTAGSAVLPLDVRFFDLAWEWDCRTGPRGAGLDANRAGYLERQLRTLAAELLGDPLSPHEVSQFVDDLHNPKMLKRAGYPRGPKATEPRLQRVVRYLTDSAGFSAGSRPVAVDAVAEARAVEEMQTWLRGEVNRRGLAVEINPTSNFLIGNLGEWRRHPLFRMNPPDGGGRNPVPLVVGSDDPLVFATGLPDEYPALERALEDADVPRPAARRWLDEVRSTGVKFRFTLPGSLDEIKPVSAYNDLLAEIPRLIH